MVLKLIACEVFCREACQCIASSPHCATSWRPSGYRRSAPWSTRGRQFVELAGGMRLVRKLVHGEWDANEFLVVEPGRRITGVYDWDRIMDQG